MSKSNIKTIIMIIGAVVAVAAIVTLAVIYRDRLVSVCGDIRDKITAKKNKIIHADEFADYADV